VPNTENITKKEFKGIELVVKALKKKYPFITGFNIFPDYENKYRYTLFVDLKINFEELSKYSGFELSDSYFKDKDSLISKTFLALYFNSESIGNQDSVDVLVDYFIELKSSIDKDMGDFYGNSIPDEFKIKIKDSDASYLGEYFSGLSLDGFTDDSISENS
jgi:hypothetical protein